MERFSWRVAKQLKSKLGAAANLEKIPRTYLLASIGGLATASIFGLVVQSPQEVRRQVNNSPPTTVQAPEPELPPPTTIPRREVPVPDAKPTIINSPPNTTTTLPRSITTTSAPATLVSAPSLSPHIQVAPPANAGGLKLGIDRGFPNCHDAIKGNPVANMVGVNDGRPLTVNPCLAAEAASFSSTLEFILNTANPGMPATEVYQSGPKQCGSGDEGCFDYDYGYQAAKYSIVQTNNLHLYSPYFWLDVEGANDWTSNQAANRETLQGMADAIHKFAPESSVGFYSNTSSWSDETGNWRNGQPDWVVDGNDNSQASAKADCQKPGFSGVLPTFVQQQTTVFSGPNTRPLDTDSDCKLS